jgi:hypothetical protein
MCETLQILPNRNVEDNSLTSGVINFEWSTERGEAVGANTFLDIQFDFYNSNGGSRIPFVSANNISLNMNAPAILFDSIGLKINGQIVCEITNYSIIDFLRMRQQLTGYALDNVYNNLMITNGSASTRADITNKAASIDQSVMTFDFVKNVLPLELLFEGLGSSIKGKANYCLYLQPNVQYKNQIYVNSGALINSDIVKNVKGMILYVEKKTLKYDSNFKEVFRMNNIRMFKEPVLSSQGEEQRTFYLSPKTKGVTIAFQAISAGQGNNTTPITNLNTQVYTPTDDTTNYLTFLQLNYLGKNYTPSGHQLLKTNSAVIGTGNTNNNAYAYYSSIRQIGNDEPESEDSYYLRGPYQYFNLYNPENIKNNNVLTVRYRFSGFGAGLNLLVFEHTEHMGEITVANHEIRNITIN